MFAGVSIQLGVGVGGGDHLSRTIPSASYTKINSVSTCTDSINFDERYGKRKARLCMVVLLNNEEVLLDDVYSGYLLHANSSYVGHG